MSGPAAGDPGPPDDLAGPPAPRVLVAGVGNLFLSDDAFGVEVARRLAGRPLPDGVAVHDFGIGGVHLVYELLEGYDVLVLVDALRRGGQPGTVYLLEPGDDPDAFGRGGFVDAHDLDPAAVLAHLRQLGGDVGRVLVVGCEPASLDEGIGLSAAVEAAVEPAAARVEDLVARITAEVRP